ncbi:unnamed protein product [Ostreobium quekettii]|uniref:Uncharacterized protein n=1 Tax=Ostreobium quekettii TaxID=121088 RepID=A0A8S1J433_9CHLO|nr:unnamed protein product [Ostreobium quekettii]|eukprot:evm.model.scf_1952.1 EVM.evm.TU.scf_1952.1   scf_1952:3299-5920(+)
MEAGAGSGSPPDGSRLGPCCARRRDFEVNGDFRVLLVEEDECTKRVVERMLRQCKYKVVSASGGKEALRQLRNGEEIDLVLADASMPEVESGEMLREVLRLDARNRVPVIVMSVEDKQEAIVEALQAGASDYLIKPVRRNELATLWQHIWRSKQVWNRRSRASPRAAAGDAKARRKADVPEKGKKRAPAQRNATPGRVAARCTANGFAGGRCRMGTNGHLARQHTSAAVGAARGCRPESTQLGATAALRALASQNGYSDGSMSNLTRYTRERYSSDSQPQQQSMLTNSSSCGLQDGRSSALLWLSEALSRPHPEQRLPPQGTRYSSCGTSFLPPALQEIVAIGDLQERLHSSASGSSPAFNSPLQYSRDHSAFTTVSPRAGSATYDLPNSGLEGHVGLSAHGPEWEDGARQYVNVPCEFLHPGTSHLQAPGSPHARIATGDASRGEMARNLAHSVTCLPAQVNGNCGGTKKANDAQRGLLYDREGGIHNLEGIQASVADSSMLSALLGMQQNLALHQGKTMGRHHPPNSNNSAEARRLAAVAKFREKRKHRSFAKKVRYESRKKLAEQRPRVRGQFVKTELSGAVDGKQVD